MEIETALEKFGLDKNESLVYISCLKLGSSLASQISKDCKIQRASIYDITERLIDKGIVSYSIKNGKKFFYPASPEQLFKIIEEKTTALSEVFEKLKQLENSKKSQPKIEVYHGKEGLKSIFNDILRSKKTIYGYGSAGLSEQAIEWEFPHIVKERIKLKIKAYFIFDKNKLALKKKKLPCTEVRFIEKNFEDVTFTEIYGDKLVIFIYTKIPVAILINSSELSKSYKKYFDILWKNSEK